MDSLSSRLEAVAASRGLEVVYCFKDGAALAAAYAAAVLQELDDLTPKEVWGTSSGAIVGRRWGRAWIRCRSNA